MTYEMMIGQGNHTRGRIYALLSKPGVEEPGKTDVKRERLLALLKSRYGYSNDLAVDELERLLKQFYKMNKSLNFHRIRPSFKHRHVD